MFRYIALAWDDTTPAVSSLARRLGLEVRSIEDWQLALNDDGLQVFVIGTKDRVNGAYPLHPAGGVIVGKLFRRREVAAAPASDVVLSESEVQDIRFSSNALIDTFWGRYIAFIRSASGSAHVLRDPSGTLPCFLIRHHGVSIVFSLLEDALALPSLADAPRVNWDGVAAHILVGELGARETCLEGVSQILPGEQVGLGDQRATLLWNAVDIARAPTCKQRRGSRQAVARCGDRVHEGLGLALRHRAAPAVGWRRLVRDAQLPRPQRDSC